MKRVFHYFTVFLLVFTLLLSGCGNTLKKQLEEESKMNFDKYNYDVYLKTPIWKGDLITHETLLFVEDENGNYTAELMYEPTRIVSFKSATLAEDYAKGVDYEISGKTVTLIKSGAMPRLSYKEYYPDVNNGDAIDRVGGGYLKLVGGSYFHEHQVAVSYRHKEKWNGPVPKYKGELLPRSVSKLKNNEPIKILFYGDSITWGGDSSGLYGVSPKAPIWPLMTVSGLQKYYGNAKIDYVNTAVGGFNSTEGVQNMKEKAADIAPDLCFLAFGMNDATQGTVPDKVKENVVKIMDAVLAVNPNCEFVIVATMLPNAEVAFGGGSMLKTHGKQIDAFLTLEKEGVAVMNFTEMSSYMLSLKKFRDMTGNNVNHPNDFLARIYAETAIKTLCENY